MSVPSLVHFVAGSEGPWRIYEMRSVIGPSLADAERLLVREGHGLRIEGGRWTLKGATSNARYANRPEIGALRSVQAGLGRSSSTRAALIPIRKSDSWWDLAQDERRAVFEEQSRHIGLGIEYLPAIARRLHHCRELGGPFDFLTWFEYAPEHSDIFEELVIRLRATPEWQFVDWEVDIRLTRD